MLGPIAFPTLFGYPAVALMDQHFELFFDGTQRPSGGRFSFQAKAGNDLSVQAIVLGTTQHRKSEEPHLSGVKHTDGQARLVQGPYQCLAINSSSFQPKVDLL